ncbi:MAG: hypothetical protein D6814_05300, partial [Calditrichaeota bacterium]
MASSTSAFFRQSRRRSIVQLLLLACALLILPGLTSSGFGQRSTTGTDFIFAFLPNSNPDYQLQVNLVGEHRTTATIEYPVGQVIAQVDIIPGKISTANIPREAGDLDSWTGSLDGDANAVRISAPMPFSCYAINRSLTSSDGSVAVPVQALNNLY